MRIIASVSVFFAGACVQELPPAATPEAVAPTVEAAAPTAGGHGRLVVDVVEGPSPIRRVSMESQQVDDGTGRGRWRFYEASEILCAASPCVADLPVGNILLGFPVLGDPNAMEVELVHVGPEATVYRRSLSVYDGDTGAGLVLGILGATFGSAAAITGAALLPVGLGNHDDGLALAGGITLGAGAVLLALGIWAIILDSPTLRPGSAVHFPLAAANPGSGE